MSTSIYSNNNHGLNYGMYTVYITINLINLNYYIGVHKISEKPKEYYGSGHKIKYAIKKYGKENFYQRILYITDNIKQAYDVEAKLVTQEIVDDVHSYNLTVGGKIPPCHKNKTRNTQWKERQSAAKLGHFVSNETKDKIRQANTGKVAINDGINMKFISQNDIQYYTNLGWKLGKLSSQIELTNLKNKGKVSINKDGVMKRVFPSDIQQYIDAGWKTSGHKYKSKR